MANRLLITGAMAIVCACAAAGAARAEDTPVRKSGLWELTIDTGANKVVARQCVDAASQAAAAAKVKSLAESMCSKRETRRQGDVFVQDSVCQLMGSERIAHSETTAISENEFRSVNTVHYHPPMNGMTDTTSTASAKWLGPCDADLSPGEMIVNGRKIKMPAQP